FYEGVIILATLAFLEFITGFLSLKNQRFAHLISGKPVILIEDGRIIRDNLKKEKFNVDDLMQELRKQGVADVDEVHKGILESCGGFTVILKEADQPVSRRDLGMTEFNHVRVPTAEGLTRQELLSAPALETIADISLELPQKLENITKQLRLISEKVDELSNELL
ncbi:MAG: DUF421 domain-containing protein, partial [Syntrophomonadaceae bacterium]|nr:DUF421 domain-containing protein [Syntrophomonadaceae bacterium]